MNLRSVPNLTVIRPADARETAQAWRQALLNTNGPTVLVLSRQNLPLISGGKAVEGVARGAYVLWQADDATPAAVIIATGSEAPIALAAGQQLAAEGINTRVVSMPSWELFDRQPAVYRNSVLPPAVRTRVAVEAGQVLGWEHYEHLALDDIRQAADLLLPVYVRTQGLDGYVSLEVSPKLAYDSAGTIAEAKRLHAALGRPNVMIKVPATPAGIPAVTALTAAGISVNATLIFSA